VKGKIMDFMRIFYPESRFGGFTDIDGTILFYTRVNSLVKPSSVVLNVGCGRGACADDPVPVRKNLQVLKGKCARVIGIDVDEEARSNPFIDEFRLIEGARWPVEDESIDLCVCDYVLEHVQDPDSFFSECRRVIRQGGYLCIRTPNVFSYFGLFSRLIPDRYHAGALTRMKNKKEEDVFPTVYRCNTRRKLSRILAKYGFDSVVYCHEAEPSYLSFSKFLYRLGVLHQRFAPGLFRLSLLAYGTKVQKNSVGIPHA
jgi:SAM-dependent methyltransferase